MKLFIKSGKSEFSPLQRVGKLEREEIKKKIESEFRKCVHVARGVERGMMQDSHFHDSVIDSKFPNSLDRIS